jgi:hypothetical protein
MISGYGLAARGRRITLPVSTITTTLRPFSAA